MKINRNTDLSSEEPTERATPELPQLRGRQKFSLTWKGVTVENEAADDSPVTSAIATALLLLGPVGGAGLCMYCASVIGAGPLLVGVVGLVALAGLLVTAVLLFRGMRNLAVPKA